MVVAMTETPKTHDALAEAQILIDLAAAAVERERMRQLVAHLREFSPFRVAGRGGRPIGARPDPAWLPRVSTPRPASSSSGMRLPGVVHVPHPRRSPAGLPSSGPRPRRSGRR